jgi:pimeloyl-ACP methyl ester carboxylesterase
LRALTSLTEGVSLTSVKREDFSIDTEDGYRLALREVRCDRSIGEAVLLIHQSRVPGLASWDLPVEGGSLAALLAAAGHPAYVLDMRGYGRSERPAEMDAPPESATPIVRCNEAALDIDAAVKAIRKRGAPRVAALGWGAGGYNVGYFASSRPKALDTAIFHNTLYGAGKSYEHLGAGSHQEDPARPGRFNYKEIGAYRLIESAAMHSLWDQTIPVSDKNIWRSPEVLAAYVAEALASDPTALSRTPASIRAPCGAMEDAFYAAVGRRLWDPSLITCDVLVTRSQHDFWSEPEDLMALAGDMVHANRVESVELCNCTHHVHLDRPEKGQALMLKTVVDFLAAGEQRD